MSNVLIKSDSLKNVCALYPDLIPKMTNSESNEEIFSYNEITKYYQKLNEKINEINNDSTKKQNAKSQEIFVIEELKSKVMLSFFESIYHENNEAEKKSETKKFEATSYGKWALLGIACPSVSVYGLGRGFGPAYSFLSMSFLHISSGVVLGLSVFFMLISLLVHWGFELHDIANNLHINPFDRMLKPFVKIYSQQIDCYQRYTGIIESDHQGYMRACGEQQRMISGEEKKTISDKSELLNVFYEDMEKKRKSLIVEPSITRQIVTGTFSALSTGFFFMSNGYWGALLALQIAQITKMTVAATLSAALVHPAAGLLVLIISLSLLGAISGVLIFRYLKDKGVEQLCAKFLGSPLALIDKVKETELREINLTLSKNQQSVFHNTQHTTASTNGPVEQSKACGTLLPQAV